MTTEERVARIEKSTRRLRTWVVVLGTVLMVVVSVSATAPDRETFDVIRADEVVADVVQADKVLADEVQADKVVADEVRARKLVVGETIVIGNNSGILEICDERNRTIVRMGRTPDSINFLSLWNSKGKPAISMNAERVGGIPGPVLARFDGNGRLAIYLFAETQGGSSLRVFDSRGNPTAVVE